MKAILAFFETVPSNAQIVLLFVMTISVDQIVSAVMDWRKARREEESARPKEYGN